jgi:peroxiredoxin family protein
MKESLVIFLHNSRYDRLYQAVNILLTASSMGWRCHLFLFLEALASYMDGTWDQVDITSDDGGRSRSGESLEEKRIACLQRLQKSFELSGHPSLYEMLDSARKEDGGLTVCACSASVRLLSLDPSRVKEKVDEIIGLSTMLRIAAEAGHTLYI